jgi:hypothetical protein
MPGQPCYGRLRPLSRLKLYSLRSALTTATNGQNVPAIRAYGSGTTNLTTANQHKSQSNFTFPWCYGPELTSRHFIAWALDRKIDLVHIQPGKMPTWRVSISKLREECLLVSWFQNLFEARRIIAAWRRDYNERRPHSSLNYMTPAEFAAQARGGKDAGSACLENALGVSHFPTATAAAS